MRVRSNASIGNYQNYEKTVLCTEMETSIESTMSLFNHYCHDIFNSTYTPELLLPPRVDDIDPYDSISGFGSSSRHRHRKLS